ncbi:MAG: DUF488 family protein, N3 subclade [Sulfuriferula sp.]
MTDFGFLGTEFRDCYFQELRSNPETIEDLEEHVHRDMVTLVYDAKDKTHNHALALKEYLEHIKRHS